MSDKILTTQTGNNQYDNQLIGVTGIKKGQEVAIGATNQQSAATTTHVVLVHSDTACYVSTGSDPDAQNDANKWFLPASVILPIAITKGDKIAAYHAANTGTLYILECGAP